MASATDSIPEKEEKDLALAWSGRWSLGFRIRAVNILTILLVVLSTLYLDVFRTQLSKERQRQTRIETLAIGQALEHMQPTQWKDYLGEMSIGTKRRFRLYGADGQLLIDSWASSGPTYTLRDPTTQAWTKNVARALDRGFNLLVGAKPLDDYSDPSPDRLGAWAEGERALRTGKAETIVRNAPDMTPMISAAVRVGDDVLLATDNDRTLTHEVRNQRALILAAMGLVIAVSIFLSSFLARTIVRPLRRLAIAAQRVRLGRAREVWVPRLPTRTDEIGLLARAVSDMNQSLRHRIDNIEAFAADVSHELKNPLASLRSALDGMDRVTDPQLQARLMEVARDDVLRLDRLITDISEAARTDAELSRAQFERVDLGPLVEGLVHAWEGRRETGDARIAFARPRKETAIVLGRPDRLARAIDNLIDNAISFSPPGGLVEIAVAHVARSVIIRIDDEGPGVPSETREKIFNRFHSDRPDEDEFGRHSGLGLAIARAIVEGHDGVIDVTDRDDAPSGARFTISLPAAD